MLPPRCSQCPKWVPRASYTAGLTLCASCEETAWELWGRHLEQEPEPLFLGPRRISVSLLKRFFAKGIA